MPSIPQQSFAAGELSPSLYGRTDLSKYKSGAATLRNWQVDYRGGASTRAGTRYVATSASDGSGLPPRVIHFQFSTAQGYALEFGDGYIAFYRNGVPILSGGVPYTIASPYALADLPLLKMTQSADVMTLVHRSYTTMQLQRFADTNWVLIAAPFGVIQPPPTGGVATPTHGSETAATGDAGSTAYTYVITAVAADTGEESVAGAQFNNPGNSRIMTSDGNAFMTLTWVAPTGAAPALYNIYRNMEVPNSAAPPGSIFGFVGSSTGLTYTDRNGIPDFTQGPPQNKRPFDGGNNPGVTAYFVQRQWYGGSTSKPATINGSKIASFNNFDVGMPVQAGDAITVNIASVQVDGIKCFVPMPSGMIVGTAGGAYLLTGGGVGPGGIPAAISPASIVVQPQVSTGFSDLPPIVRENDVLFGQAKGSIIRDLTYNLYASVYTGTDVTTLSNHLFTNRTIREWADAEEPYKIIWCVRDDGTLIGLTINRAQEVMAWHRHDSQGLFQSVCTVSEGNVNATYFVVRRVLNGAWTYIIERMADRALLDGNPALGIAADIEKAWCVDCGLALAQRAPGIPLGVGFRADTLGATDVVFTGPGAFSGGDIGSVIRGSGGRATVTGLVAGGAVSATITAPFALLPNDPGGQPVQAPAGAWTITAPVTTISGLDHLDGKLVAILADGNVLPQQRVVGGTVTLDHPASNVVVGLAYQCQLQTLNLDVGDSGPGGTVQGKLKKIGAVTVSVKDTRGLKAGRTPATVVPVKEWNSNVDLGGPLPLVTGLQRIIMDQQFEQMGRLWLQVDDPVPATVLSVISEVSFGG